MAFGVPLVWEGVKDDRGQTWLWSRRVDLLWVSCGAFFIFATLAIPLSFWTPMGGLLSALFLHLSIVSNYPHITATYQVILRERKIRPRNFLQLLVSTPAMLGLLAAGAFWPDLFWGPIVRLYLTWSAHHYAAQHFGISAMYCARSGKPLQPREKSWLQGAFLGVGAFMMLMANTTGGDPNASARVVGLQQNGGYVPIAGFPEWAYYPGLLLVAASIAAFYIAERRYRQRTGSKFDLAVWLLFVTNIAWFVVPNIRIPGHGSWMWPNLTICLLGAPPFFHSAQYLAVTGHRSRLSGSIRPIVLFAALVFSGFALFHGPVSFIPKIFPIDGLRGLLLLVAMINLHHFWIDGLIWRRPKPAAKPALAPAVAPVPSVG